LCFLCIYLFKCTLACAPYLNILTECLHARKSWS